MNTLKAEKRSMDIKAKKLRREGYVTGNVFGREMKESVPVKMEKAAVDRLLKACHVLPIRSQVILSAGSLLPLMHYMHTVAAVHLQYVLTWKLY